MDAKPQRPARTLRVSRDENAIVRNPPSKTLHHRNKSTPALSAMVDLSAVAKPLGKRTAFGDVSNTAFSRPGKDEPAPSQKLAVKAVLQENKVSDPAGRPTQRQRSTSKASLTTSASLSNLHVASNNAATAGDKPLANAGRKRNTIYRDPSLQTVTEVEAHGDDRRPSDTFTTSAAALIRVNDLYRQVKNHVPAPSAPANGQMQEDKVMGTSNNALVVRQSEKAIESVRIQATTDVKGNAFNAGRESGKGVVTEHSREQPTAVVLYDYPPDVSDPPEEYWDEEYDYPYEEDGYATTRSHRSRGDNTTGAATVEIFPNYNQEARRELAMAKKIVESSHTAEDYDEECWDTSMMTEYGPEIFQYLRDLERRLLPNAHYMDNQAEIQWSMRSVLMDWLVQVHLRFSLLPETLFLCVNYIDRFLSCKIVSLGKLQLVGATAIFIAAKYEEINCPSVHEVVYMVDNGYTAEEILKAERFMLSMLQFELGWPGPMSFLRRISKADDYDLDTRTLAKYFLEVTIMDERFVGTPPSFLAAGAHCLSRMMLRKGSWTPEHVYYSGYTYGQLHSLLSAILDCCDHPQKHHAAIYEKYADKRFKRASYFVENELAKGFTLPDVPRTQAVYRKSLLENVPFAQRY